MNKMYILHLITRLFQYCTVSNTDVFYYLLNILYWVPFVEKKEGGYYIVLLPRIIRHISSCFQMGVSVVVLCYDFIKI